MKRRKATAAANTPPPVWASRSTASKAVSIEAESARRASIPARVRSARSRRCCMRSLTEPGACRRKSRPGRLRRCCGINPAFRRVVNCGHAAFFLTGRTRKFRTETDRSAGGRRTDVTVLDRGFAGMHLAGRCDDSAAIAPCCTDEQAAPPGPHGPDQPLCVPSTRANHGVVPGRKVGWTPIDRAPTIPPGSAPHRAATKEDQ